MNATADLVRIECKCKTCKINAEKVGASFPLKADVTPALAASIKSGDVYLHEIVYIAHERGALGEAMRRKSNISPVA